MRVTLVLLVGISVLCASAVGECPGFRVHSAVPRCAPDQFTFRVFKVPNPNDLSHLEINVTGVLDTTPLDRLFRFCEGTYSVQLTNQGVFAECSPANWSVSDENNTNFFDNNCTFLQMSQVWFNLDSENHWNFLKNEVDYGTTVVQGTTVCTRDTTKKDSSSHGFWLHTFWGIFLIVLFCLIGFILLLVLLVACIRQRREKEASDEERQPLVNDNKKKNKKEKPNQQQQQQQPNADNKKQEKRKFFARRDKNNNDADEAPEPAPQKKSFREKFFQRNNAENAA
eukprot:TRINITY_DN1281_c0_g1_i1.p1 TRINITY_DN1281_c0_g1~~TRINITY_DN1281_c0_g1_i1.p1  ORF type:complete len:283 (-),score=79.81 TRINITY_DN1281_c0_g1_i1:76-924(-)